VLIYAGGMLTLRKEDTVDTKRRLEAGGVRHVFPPGTSLKDSLSVFEADLAALRARRKAVR
jgi:methylmalonyl-CoA mutase cobalamin-binding subunit